jgi:NAD(P)-dependent dehydrogenase (short-subunit alcohol dehydrogenase family)
MGDLRGDGGGAVTGRLAGKVAIVTGAAGGIGAGCAARFRDEGAEVVASDLAPPDAALGIADLPFVRCDVSHADDVAQLVETALGRRGRIDALVHCAALLGGSGPFLEVTRESWESYIHVNLTGTFLVGQAVARAMAKTGGGRIVAIGSVNSFAAEPTAAPYVASKGGVRLLTKAMAVDLARHGITVNMIAPGPIITPRNAETFASPPLVQSFERLVPVGVAGGPADIANAAVFLCEEASRYVTGTEIVVDGGTLALLMPVEGWNAG